MAGATILVTGATGFLGEAMVERLIASGRSVRGVVRADPGPGAVAVGDLSADTDWSAALQGVDTVVHCAARAHVLKEATDNPLPLFRAVNTEATTALAQQAAAAGVRRFIFISSIGVNGAETHGRPFRHDDPPHPHSPYAVSKHEAEMALTAIAAQTGLEVVIIRPPLITGPDPKGNLATLNRFIDKGLPLPFGLATKNRRDLVSRDTLCRLVEAVIDHPAAAGQTFLVSDGRPVSTRELLEQLAQARGRTLTLLPVPPALLTPPLKLLGKGAMASQLFGDLEVDITHTRQTLGWAP
jgi:nucleoside-diphosphate-sugar epimerase